VRFWASFLLLVVAAIPARPQFVRDTDFSGTWKLEVPGADAKSETLLKLKMKGHELAGTLKTPNGEFAVENGHAEGQDLFFNVVIERDEYKLKTTYRGHLFSEEIQFTVEAGERTLQVIARRATS
jgi:hypothetical protein